jgi:NADH:ubiquinone oxidoreductase subunit 6 (subunit J)
MKNKLFPIGIGGGLLVIITIYSILKGSLTFLTLSNRFFLIGLPFLSIGTLFWIFSSGFFDHFQHSMHQAFSRKQKKKSEFQALSQVGQGRYSFWLIIAAILILASIICALLTLI